MQVDSTHLDLTVAFQGCQDEGYCSDTDQVYSMCEGAQLGEPLGATHIDFSNSKMSPHSFCYNWTSDKITDVGMKEQTQDADSGQISDEDIHGKSNEKTQAKICIQEVKPEMTVSQQEADLAQCSSKHFQLFVSEASISIYNTENGIQQDSTDLTAALSRGQYFFSVNCTTGRVRQHHFSQKDTTKLVGLKHDMAQSFNHHKPVMNADGGYIAEEVQPGVCAVAGVYQSQEIETHTVDTACLNDEEQNFQTCSLYMTPNPVTTVSDGDDGYINTPKYSEAEFESMPGKSFSKCSEV